MDNNVCISGCCLLCKVACHPVANRNTCCCQLHADGVLPMPAVCFDITTYVYRHLGMPDNHSSCGFPDASCSVCPANNQHSFVSWSIGTPVVRSTAGLPVVHTSRLVPLTLHMTLVSLTTVIHVVTVGRLTSHATGSLGSVVSRAGWSCDCASRSDSPQSPL